MLDKCASGIDLITENLGELYSRGTYLFMGDPKTGKTTFVLQFILQGLKEGKSCILVTSDSARDFAINAETLGMPVSPYILEGRLIIYEYAVTKKFTAEQFFKDIIGVVSEHEISRFALDSFIGQKIPAAEIQVFSQKLPDFLDEMEKKKIVSFITLELPLAPEVFTIKKKLEVAALGVFLLKKISDVEKAFVVRKLTGQLAQSNKEFRFAVQKESGIKEIKDVYNLGFSNYFPKDKTLEVRKLPFIHSERPLEIGKLTFVTKDSALDKIEIPVLKKEKPPVPEKVSFHSKDKEPEKEKIPELQKEKPPVPEKVSFRSKDISLGTLKISLAQEEENELRKKKITFKS